MTTIVPRNSPPLMRVLDELVDDQLLASGSAVATNAIRNVYDVTPNNTPATVLPWLAWGLNSFAWADGNDDAANRAAVAEGLNSNAYKGSASQVIQ
ncbi:MAG: hypothetical protein K0U36_05545, partial [Alphaproteobacteria bacterium]|nr:hypothetical protein [Alphaproteobacteria bacterium]